MIRKVLQATGRKAVGRPVVGWLERRAPRGTPPPPLAQAPLTRESSKHPSVLAPRGSLRTGGGDLLGAVEAAAEAGEDGDEGDGVLRVVRQEEEAAGTSGGGGAGVPGGSGPGPFLTSPGRGRGCSLRRPNRLLAGSQLLAILDPPGGALRLNKGPGR